MKTWTQFFGIMAFVLALTGVIVVSARYYVGWKSKVEYVSSDGGIKIGWSAFVDGGEFKLVAGRNYSGSITVNTDGLSDSTILKAGVQFKEIADADFTTPVVGTVTVSQTVVTTNGNVTIAHLAEGNPWQIKPPGRHSVNFRFKCDVSCKMSATVEAVDGPLKLESPPSLTLICID